MDMLKKFFPFSFRVKEKNVTDLIISILIYVAIGFVGSLVIGLLGKLPIIGFLFGLVGSLLDVYGLVGIILAVLSFLKLVK